MKARIYKNSTQMKNAIKTGVKKMKTFGILICITFIVHSFESLAQIPNSSFEKINPDGTLCNWGNVYIFGVSIDSNGVNHSDSIVYDNPFYAPVNDAFGGSHALQLANAYNFTTNTGIAGAVACDEDSVFSSWGLLNLIPTNATPFNPFTPFNFGFNYKFFPVYGDSAYAQFALWDSVGNQLANAFLLIADSASTYTQAAAPIIYSQAGDAAFYSLSIHNFYTATPGLRQPTFGTRLIVDNVGFNFVTNTTAIQANESKSQLNISPNPAANRLKLNLTQTSTFEVRIINKLGEQVAFVKNESELDLSALASGFYFISVTQNNQVLTSKFVKN